MRQEEGRTRTINAKDGAKLTTIMRCKVNFVRPIFTNTHAHREESE